MKICITRSQRFLYSETFIQNQIKGLSQRAEVVTLHSGRLPEREEDGTLIHALPFWILHKITKAVTGKRSNIFSNYGLKQFLRREKVDLVLANYGLSAAHLLPVCRDLNLPLVPHFHGYDATQRKVLSQYRKDYLNLFAYSPLIIAVSRVMKEQLISIGAPSEKLAVIPYGIDLKQFRPVDQKRTGMPIFLAVGRFTPKKAPHITISAFHQVHQQYPAAKLVMIGAKDGEYARCLALVNQLGIADAVEFTGVLPPDQVAAYMQKAMVFIQHSITADNGDMEGTPNSILEAGASGLPVVSTRHGGILDAVVHGQTGFLVDEQDGAAMANHMKFLLEHPEQASEMGRMARIHIEENYDFEKQMDKLLLALKKAAGHAAI